MLEFDRALAVLTNSTMQFTPTPARSFKVLGTNGSAVLQPIEPPGLKFDFAELAAAVRGGRALAVDLDTELLVQETLLRACDMM